MISFKSIKERVFKTRQKSSLELTKFHNEIGIKIINNKINFCYTNNIKHTTKFIKRLHTQVSATIKTIFQDTKCIIRSNIKTRLFTCSLPINDNSNNEKIITIFVYFTLRDVLGLEFEVQTDIDNNQIQILHRDREKIESILKQDKHSSIEYNSIVTNNTNHGEYYYFTLTSQQIDLVLTNEVLLSMHPSAIDKKPCISIGRFGNDLENIRSFKLKPSGKKSLLDIPMRCYTDLTESATWWILNVFLSAKQGICPQRTVRDTIKSSQITCDEKARKSSPDNVPNNPKPEDSYFKFCFSMKSPETSWVNSDNTCTTSKIQEVKYGKTDRVISKSTNKISLDHKVFSGIAVFSTMLFIYLVYCVVHFNYKSITISIACAVFIISVFSTIKGILSSRAVSIDEKLPDTTLDVVNIDEGMRARTKL